MNSPRLKDVRLFLVVFMYFTSQPLFAASKNATCGIEPGQPLTNAYGPWDYTNPGHEAKLGKVLGAHFNTNVERLIAGQSGSISHDIDYTLRAIPNYHRALLAMSKKERISGYDREFYSAECYFKRAIYFQPNDAVSRMVFGMHLHMLKNYVNALQQYREALTLAPHNLETHYNIALALVELDELDKAFEHAEVAYNRGYPLQGLKDILKKSGYYSTQ